MQHDLLLGRSWHIIIKLLKKFSEESDFEVGAFLYIEGAFSNVCTLIQRRVSRATTQREHHLTLSRPAHPVPASHDLYRFSCGVWQGQVILGRKLVCKLNIEE